MKRVFYDLEFYDNGQITSPLSIGMVDAAGRELYLVRDLKHLPHLRNIVSQHEFLSVHVWPELQRAHDAGEVTDILAWPRLIEEFLRGTGAHTRDDLELWGYYPAYDHVCLAQLWGPMSMLPGLVPMVTFDLWQEARRLGFAREEFPSNPDEHNALADAKWNKELFEMLDETWAAMCSLVTDARSDISRKRDGD
jgi:hypothetical protein